MKMRKMGSYDGKDLYKAASGTMFVKSKDGKMSKLGDEYDESKLSKAEKEGDEEDLDAEEDEAEKSITAEELHKSIAALQKYAATPDRKTELLQKAQSGLEPAEATELYELLGGQSAGESDSLAKSVTEGIGTGTNSEAAFDVAPFLQEHNEALTKSLGTLADAIEGQGQRDHEFNMLMARAVADMGNMVKSMSESQTSDFAAIRERLGIIEAQPIRAPKSVGLQGAQPMNKSFAGQEEGAGPFDGLNKAQVFGVLDEMLKSGVSSVGGTDISLLNARIEQTGEVTRQEMNAINEHRKSKASAA